MQRHAIHNADGVHLCDRRKGISERGIHMRTLYVPAILPITSYSNKTEGSRAPILWMHEAITYLGIDRLGLARPDRAMYRLIRKGAIHPRRIVGHFAFGKSELEVVAANGDQKRGRGRPRKHI